MPSSMKTFRRPPTAQQAVLAEMRRAILEGDLAPGEQIVQNAIANELGVSRLPVREALRILEGEGQLVYKPHLGYYVADFSLEELLEVQRIRELLEPEAVTAAVPRLTDADTDRMRAAYEEMEAAGAADDIAAMNAAHTEFHFALLEASAMPRLTRVLRQLWTSCETYRAVYHGNESLREAAQQEHRRILEAAEQRDADLLVELLHRHRQRTVTRLAGPLRKTTGEPPTDGKPG